MSQIASRFRGFAYHGPNGTLTAGALPFILIQLSVLCIFTTHFSWTGLALCGASYFVRMFAITAFYHRYFSHRTYKMGRVMQFVGAFLGASATQKGGLWWGAHHREHHKHSDTPEDPHSSKKGFWHSHFLWFMYGEGNQTDYESIKEFTKYPELMFVERHWHLAPLSLALGLFAIGGWHYAVWGYFVPTFLVQNVTYCINSVTHILGKQYFSTGEESRNHWFLGILALGEGWHNNHHRYQASTRNGFYWYEFDITYLLLKLMSFVGLVRDLTPVPFKILEEGRINRSLLKESRRLGGELQPIAVLRDEIHELSDQFAARARVLRLEIEALSEHVGTRARSLRTELQSLNDQVISKARQLHDEVQEIGGQVAQKGRHLQTEIQHLHDLVADKRKQLGAETTHLHNLVAEKARMLGSEIQELGEQVAAKGKHVKFDVQELSELMAATGSSLKREVHELSEQASQRGRMLKQEIDNLGGLLPAFS